MMNVATIYIRCSTDNRYFWVLCLSENPKNPTCRSVTDYKELRKCRQGALRFAKHLTSKIKLKGYDEVVIVDSVGDQRKLKKNVEIINDGLGG